MAETDLWYRDYWKRLKERTEYQRLDPRVPCLRWYWAEMMNEVEELVFARTGACGRILDFGAGEARLKAKFKARGFSKTYDTIDLSEEQSHTFRSLAEAEGPYDAIFCFEVIEHMTLNEYVSLMDEFARRLNPGGHLIISTPNPLCVVPMWAADAGHVQQYPLADLVADFRVRGFETEAFRVRLGEAPRGLRERLRQWAQRALCYLLSVDYAHGLLIVGRLGSRRR